MIVAVTAVVLNVAVVVATAGEAKYGREDWRSVAAQIGTVDRPRVFVVSPREGEKAFRYYRPAARQLFEPVINATEIDVIALPSFQHRLARNPVSPRPTRPPHLAGFRLTSTEYRGSFTLFRLRAALPTKLTLQTLRSLALEPTIELLTEPAYASSRGAAVVHPR